MALESVTDCQQYPSQSIPLDHARVVDGEVVYLDRFSSDTVLHDELHKGPHMAARKRLRTMAI